MAAPGEILRGVAIFGALSDSALEFLQERLEEVTVAAGGVFFEEGEMESAVYVLEEGRAEVVKSRGGRSVVLASFEPGACFGEVALVAICTRSATVRAVTDCRAVRLDNEVILELHRRDPEQFTLLQMNLGREVARRLNETTELLFECLLGGAGDHGRIAGLLGRTLE